VRDAAIHCVLKEADGCEVRLHWCSGSPRAFSPRDDKCERIYHEDSKEILRYRCHCEEVTKLATRQSIVSRGERSGSLFGW